jgi:hypothetical protein
MLSTSEIRSLTSLSKDARQAVAAAFSALAQWRGEVLAANDRCLTKALDQMAVAQRALGWPDHATAAARESLLKTAKMHTHMMDRVMDAWEQQLKSQRDPAGVPNAFKLSMPAFSEHGLADPVSDMMRMGEMALVPFKLWIKAAEAWQRNWASAMSARAERPPAPRPQRRPRQHTGRTRSR